MNQAKMGQVQLRIMQTLWKLQRATARELTDVLNREEPIAHSTVQTLLRQLEAKGAVDHEVEGRTFYFYPLVEHDKVKRSATRELLQNVFGGSVAGLVSHLLANEKVSSAELAELRKLIDKQRKQ